MKYLYKFQPLLKWISETPQALIIIVFKYADYFLYLFSSSLHEITVSKTISDRKNQNIFNYNIFLSRNPYAIILTKLECKKLTSVDSHILKKFSETVQIFFSSPIVTIPTGYRELYVSIKYVLKESQGKKFGCSNLSKFHAKLCSAIMQKLLLSFYCPS